LLSLPLAGELGPLPMKITVVSLVIIGLLVSASAPPPVRTGATALAFATRREADSLRVWVSWPSARPAPKLRLLGITPAGIVAPWPDSVQWRPAGAQMLTSTVAAAGLGAVDRLRLREIGYEPPAPTDIPVGAVSAARLRTYALVDTAGHVLCRSWVRTDELVRPRTFGLELPLTLFRYSSDFQAALPPMAVGVAPASAATLGVIATRELVPADTFRVRQPGLYALRQGASGPLDPLLVEDGGFPDIRTAPDLIRPLVYLTTAQERQALYDATEPKKATDGFWLDVAQGEAEVARRLIRTYYGRVAEANRLFSAHKPGWMTDRGLLWVVFGPPPRVEQTADGEDWVYRDVAGTSGARFRFRRRPSLFAPDHYELQRERSHENVWYAATAAWRRGQMVVGLK
jgi:GWxTD domain-containing protein